MFSFNRRKIKVGISFNKKVGGATADSLKKAMKKFDSEIVDIDYREIVSEDDCLEDMYQNTEKITETFRKAKRLAHLYLQKIDCLILPGNRSMVDPRLYGEPRGDNRIDLNRTVAELALAHVAIQKGMPILAICGGHQVVNVYWGAKLKNLESEDLSFQGYRKYTDIIFERTSELAQIFFKSTEIKNDMHIFFGAHEQVVQKESWKNKVEKEGLLSLVGVANDATKNIEAIEASFGAPLYSLQFHPEVGAFGMYCIEVDKIIFQAETEQHIHVNLQILKAFKQAGETFSIKKKLNVDLKKKIDDEKIEPEKISPVPFSNKFSQSHSIFFTPHKCLLELSVETKNEIKINPHHSSQIRSVYK